MTSQSQAFTNDKSDEDAKRGDGDTSRENGNVDGPLTMPTTTLTTMTTAPIKEWDLLLDRIQTNALQSPTKRAMAFLGSDGNTIEQEFSYLQLEQETTNLAQTLLRSGLVKGDRCV